MSQPENGNNQTPSQNDLGSELRELGQQLETAVRIALTSEKAKQVQQDVSSGLKEIGTQLHVAVKALQDNPQMQQLVERGEQVLSQAQQSRATQDFQETLARGIAQLNDQLAAFVTRMHQPATPPSTDSSPTTGETTRLDPDQK
ncbi:MAG: hypothetical protein WCP31_07450 [Chloroflexales bacterium]